MRDLSLGDEENYQQGAEENGEKVSETFAGFDAKAIAQNYGYTPLPEQRPVNLNIDWEYVEGEIARYHEKTAVKDGSEMVVAIPVKMDSERFTGGQILVKRSAIPGETAGNVYRIDFRLDQRGVLGKGLISAANFHVQQNRDRFDIYHRETAEPFRDQGVGKHMLQLAEQIMTTEATRMGHPVTSKARVFQLEVLDFFRKNGYEVAQGSEYNYQMLVEGDERLTVKSAPMDKNAYNKRQGWILDKTKLGDSPEEAEKFWEFRNSRDFAHTIRVNKQISPDPTMEFPTPPQLAQTRSRITDKLRAIIAPFF